MSALHRPLSENEKRILCRLFIGAAFPYDLPQPVKPEDFDKLRDMVEGLKALGYIEQMENRVGDYPILRLTPTGRALFDGLGEAAHVDPLEEIMRIKPPTEV